MDPVGLYHYEGSISLVSFPQPSRRREHGSSYVSNSTRPLDSSSGLWHAMGNDTCLPFLLLVVCSMFVSMKSCISSTREFTESFAPLIARFLRGLGLMPVRSGIGLACRLAVAFVRQTMTIFDLRRVDDVVADRCMVEDRFDHYSSYIMHVVKDCY